MRNFVHIKQVTMKTIALNKEPTFIYFFSNLFNQEVGGGEPVHLDDVLDIYGVRRGTHTQTRKSKRLSLIVQRDKNKKKSGDSAYFVT